MTLLCYHSVDPGWHASLSVAPGRFEHHCAWLQRHRRVVGLDAAYELLGPGYRRLPAGVAALTFDDGFAALYEHAAPILRRHELQATVFLVAATLTSHGYAVDWVDDPPASPLRTLAVDQILGLQDEGVFAFESHSWSHRDLDRLSESECLDDLRSSRELLEELLGRRVRFLAFPRGRHAPHVRRAAAAAGYDAAFALPEGPEDADAYAIPRVEVNGHNGVRALALKCSPWYAGFRTGRAYALVRPAVRAAKR